MKMVYRIVFILWMIVGISQATESQSCRKCVEQYDVCLSDLFQGLGSMDGDDIKNCQTDRDECLEKTKK